MLPKIPFLPDQVRSNGRPTPAPFELQLEQQEQDASLPQLN